MMVEMTPSPIRCRAISIGYHLCLALGGGTTLLTAAGLSCRGLGVEPGTPEGGAMLHDGYTYWRRSISLALFSGLAISTSVLAFNLFGDGLRDALDPRSRETR